MVSPGGDGCLGDALSDTSFLDPLLRRWQRRIALTSEDKRAFAALPWSQRTFARDTYLIREGEPTIVCTLLISGFAFRQKLSTDGSRHTLTIHTAGEFVDLHNGLLDVAVHNVQCPT